MVKLVEKRDESGDVETPPPSKRPRRSVTTQKKAETPKKEEPKSKKSKPSSPAKKDTEKNPKTPKRTSGIVSAYIIIYNIRKFSYKNSMKTITRKTEGKAEGISKEDIFKQCF